jgi:hypothetical protein|tara:strand:- start:302 stop:952 length:651 start_codon:yes stop_codon:yes gene_type:complete
MRLTTLLLLTMVGCSNEKMGSGYLDEEGSPSGAEDTAGLDWESDGEYGEEASHWILSGNLTHTSGLLSSDLSSLAIEIRSESEAVVCSGGVGISTSERITDLPDDDLQVWWEIGIAAATEGSCLVGELEGVIGGSMRVGLGPVHPEIEAVMSENIHELEGGDFELRSVFAAFGEDEPVWVFGLAVSNRTDQNVGGGTGLILPDGQWKFEGVYAFPY